VELVVTGVADGQVYLVVKDSRLQAQDTPATRLAAQMKAFVEKAGEHFQVGTPTRTLAGMVTSNAVGAIPRVSDPVPGSGMVRRGLMLARDSVRAGLVREPSAKPSLGAGGPRPRARPEGRVLGSFEPQPSARGWESPATFGSAGSWATGDQSAFAWEQPATLGFAGPAGAVAAPAGSAAFAQAAFEPSCQSDLGAFADLDSPGSGRVATDPVTAAGSQTAAPPQGEPDVVYAGLVEARDGVARARVRLPDKPGDFTVEAFALDGTDWAATEVRFRTVADLQLDLDVPPFVFPGDRAFGRAIALSASGCVTLRVEKDGQPVELDSSGRFPVDPGTYHAVAADPSTGKELTAGATAEPPGKLRRYVRVLDLLEPGGALEAGGDMMELRVLPGVERPLETLAEATAGYEHLCVEQTSTKMVAAAAMLALAGKPERRNLAESILLSGIRRMESMWVPGRGFRIYPGSDQFLEHWGKMATRNLVSLLVVADCDQVSASLRDALERARSLSQEALRFYKLDWFARTPADNGDAYWALRLGGDAERSEATRVVRAWLERSERPAGAVNRRTEAAYAAACLVRLGELNRAIPLARQVTSALNEQGRLYSTQDSLAALVMLSELERNGVAAGSGRVQVDGREMTTAEAAEREVASSIRAVEGVVAVQVRKLVEEDWTTFSSRVDLRVALAKDGRPVHRVRAGDALALSVELVDGYRMGDLVWVCLPAALTWLCGGGQVKRFSVDFEGRSRLEIPLVATASTEAEGQRFAVCVRNMFEEERVGCPGRLEVVVA
ncbi:MAG: hypothetical protein AB1758_29810, partial [Candidatus Eremiobacterota bacterium]